MINISGGESEGSLTAVLEDSVPELEFILTFLFQRQTVSGQFLQIGLF